MDSVNIAASRHVLGFSITLQILRRFSLKSIITGFVCLALSIVVVAQTSSSTPTLKTRPADPNELVPNTVIAPDTPVITVQGLCEKPGNGSAMPSDCSTVVTRAQFEKIVNAVQPNMPPAAKKQFAARYVTVLLLAEKGHELGLDKGPEFDEQMYLARLQLLSRQAAEKVQRDAANVTDSAITDYYQQHAGDYKSITFDRVFIPRQKQIEDNANDPDAQKKRAATEPDMKEEADKLRARAAAGEDFTKLQQEAYDFAGSKTKATDVKLENMRKNSIPTTDAAIFDLKKGEVSQVFSDPSGYRIYKVDEIKDLPLATVHDEIARAIQGQNIKNAFDSLQSSAKATYDDAYFATPAPPSLKNPGGTPTSQAGPRSTPGNH